MSNLEIDTYRIFCDDVTGNRLRVIQYYHHRKLFVTSNLCAISPPTHTLIQTLLYRYAATSVEPATMALRHENTTEIKTKLPLWTDWSGLVGPVRDSGLDWQSRSKVLDWTIGGNLANNVYEPKTGKQTKSSRTETPELSLGRLGSARLFYIYLGLALTTTSVIWREAEHVYDLSLAYTNIVGKWPVYSETPHAATCAANIYPFN